MNIPNLIALGWSRTPIRNAHTRTRRWIVVGLLGLMPFAAAPADTPLPVELVEGYPRSYTVGEDDTVWNIASQFLRRPWQWVEVWHAGEVLYPGDVLIVSEEAGQVQIKVLKVEKRAPRVRVTRRGRPIPTIMPEAVRPFLTGPLLVQPSDIEEAGHVIYGVRDDIVLGKGDQFYATGLPPSASGDYRVFRVGGVVVNPDNGEVLGTLSLELGTARLVAMANVARLELLSSYQEVTSGDLLVATDIKDEQLPNFTPRRPKIDVTGRLLSATQGISEFARLETVVLSVGKRDRLRQGDVLEIVRAGKLMTDPFTGRLVQAPGERVGYVMAYRVYEKFSHGLILECMQPAQVYDYVRRPGA